MIDLYEFPPTRSQRARWVLEELGIEYESHIVDLTEGEQNSPSYREIHPLGVVPALATEGYTMFESVAIVMQLIDEYPESNLAPPLGNPARALYYQWCVFAAAEMDPPVMMYFDNTMRPEEFLRPPATAHDPRLAEMARLEFGQRAETLSAVLETRSHLLGDNFSGADILIGHSCFMASFTGLIGGYPVLEAYFERLQQRPAFQRAYGS